MPMRVTDPILGVTRGSAASVIAAAKKNGAKRMDQVEAYVLTVFSLAPKVGIDPAVVIAQAVHETDWFRSFWWEKRLNPAGIGITGDNAQNNVSRIWTTGVSAARSHLAHLLLYATGRIDRGGLKESDDPRFGAYVEAYGAKPQATTIAGLAGKWGVDPRYDGGVVKRGNEVFPNLPDAKPGVKPSVPKLTLATLPFPFRVSLVSPLQKNQRPGIKQQAQFVTLHETGNTNWGADAPMHERWQHAGCPGAAEVQVGVHFYVDDTEAIQMLPLDEVSWNAGCGSCLGNYAAISIEICVNANGNYEKARHNGAILAAALLNQLGLGLSQLRKHQDWSGKWCPSFLLSRGLWPDEVNQVRTAMAQGGTAVSRYAQAQPIMVGSKPWDGKRDVTVNGVGLHGQIRRVTAKHPKGAACRVWATSDAQETRSPVDKGDLISVLGWVNGQDIRGESRWWITKRFSRIWVGDTLERPTTKAPHENPDNADLPDNPKGPKIIDGVRLFRLGREGEGRVVVIEDNVANLRKKPQKSSDVVRTLAKGDKVRAWYWCEGGEINGEEHWWRLGDGTFLHVETTKEKPY